MLRKRLFACLLVIAAWCAPDASAQDQPVRSYTIGVGDRLRVSVWQEPSLDRTVEVGVDSLIVLPLVGPIKAGGYAPAQLSRTLTERYSLYKRDISQVEVVVLEYNSREVYVIGQIAQRGRYTFQEIPDIWTVIMNAGGPGQNAHLGEVRILRGKGGEERVIKVNLNAFLLGGDTTDLPKLQPGDTVYIPTASARGVDAFATNVIYVYGGVRSPGLYLVNEEEDLVGALLIAGGIDPGADNTKVKIIRRNGERRVVHELNINDYMERGEIHANPYLKPGDTIEIAERKSSAVRRFFQELIQPSFQTISSVLTLVVLIDRVNNNNR